MKTWPTRFLLVPLITAFALLCAGDAAAQRSQLARANALDQQAAQLVDRQGRYTEAEPLYKRSLEIRQKALGPEHPLVALSLSKLAALYQTQGHKAEAEPLLQRALAIVEKAFGPKHPAVAAGLDDLAAFYVRQGRSAEAEPLYKRSLAIREKALGPVHHDVAQSLSKLAELYESQQRYADAEPLRKRILAMVEKALGPAHPEVANSLGVLVQLYKNEGRYADAEPLAKRDLAILEKALGPDHPDVATGLNNLATLYDTQGRYAEAEPLFKRSLAIIEKALGREHPHVAYDLNNLAELYHHQGRYAEAEPLLKRSLEIREKVLGPKHPQLANALNNLASLYMDQGRYAEAEPLLKRSLAIMEALGPLDVNADEAFSLKILAELYVSQGRSAAETEQIYQRNLAVNEKKLGPEHPRVALGLNDLAALYVKQGRYAEAAPLYRRSLAIKEKALGPEHPEVAQSLGNLAELYRKQQRTAEAYTLSGRAVDILAQRIAVAGGDRSGGEVSEQRLFRNLFLLRVAVAYEQGKSGAAEIGESFRAAQLANSSSASQAVAGMAARFAAGTDALAAAVRQRQDLATRWQGLDRAIVQAASKPPAQRNAAAEAALRAQFAETGAQLSVLDTRIAREFPGYAELSNPRPLEIAAAQALLEPDEVMLVYLVGVDETFLWALRRDRAALYRIDIGAKALGAEVTALRERLDPDLNPTLRPFEAMRAYALYQKILMPATPLLDGAHQVFIVPDGALQSLPLGVLVTQAPTADPRNPADHREIAWFARDHALTVLPSVGALRALRQFASGAHGGAPFVGIGNPVLEGKPDVARGVKLAGLFRGALADVAAVRQLPPLPETAIELRAVAKETGASDQDLYLGERASEPLLRQARLDRYRVVEFATHGLMSGDLKGLAEPALVLTPPREATADNDGLLTASKVATLKLNADWVVLSACNTAAADGTSDAGGLSGLAKAFFYAGARSLLVSHWSVPSAATVKLVTGAFNELNKDPSIGRAEALRRAEMAMLDPSSPPEYAHPLFWAPFILAGEGGVAR